MAVCTPMKFQTLYLNSIMFSTQYCIPYIESVRPRLCKVYAWLQGNYTCLQLAPKSSAIITCLSSLSHYEAYIFVVYGCMHVCVYHCIMPLTTTPYAMVILCRYTYIYIYNILHECASAIVCRMCRSLCLVS